MQKICSRSADRLRFAAQRQTPKHEQTLPEEDSEPYSEEQLESHLTTPEGRIKITAEWKLPPPLLRMEL
jgi:hypothetical protein